MYKIVYYLIPFFTIVQHNIIMYIMKEKEFQKIILEDKRLKDLHALKKEIYSMIKPTVIKKDKFELQQINQEHPDLKKINELITQRINDLKKIYFP